MDAALWNVLLGFMFDDLMRLISARQALCISRLGLGISPHT
jgi:hypothetical protein